VIMDWNHGSIMVHTKHAHAVFMIVHVYGSRRDHCAISVIMVTCRENEVDGYEINTQ